MNPKIKLFLVLWIASMIGVVSTLLLDYTAMLAPLVEAEGITLPPITPQLQLLSLIQPAVLLTVATLLGLWLAAKVNLFAPAAQALATGGDVANALRPQWLPGIIGGLVGGTVIVLFSQMWLPALPPEFIAASENISMPVLTRFLYGGITEEILLRWGFMTLLVWLPYRLFTERTGHVPTSFYIAAILISAIVFGIGHLGIAALLAQGLTPSLVAYVIVGNALFGLIAGYLFWKFGLEAAIIAHMLAHVVMLLGEQIVG